MYSSARYFVIRLVHAEGIFFLFFLSIQLRIQTVLILGLLSTTTKENKESDDPNQGKC